ncbi:MAG: DedA family protein [Planctomycetota bacterium]|nr:MAG: DedA family protein [Planctomycetota bacterium]
MQRVGDFLQDFLRLFTDLKAVLNGWCSQFGLWVYALLFLIIFVETGLVILPFLPGDSLLFAVGALAADPASGLSVPLLMVLLSVAAILGDAVNYYVGHRVGPAIFRSDTSWLLNRRHLLRAQSFYEKHGGKTIFLARFIPIIRTFAPFVAGVGRMGYLRFALYNVLGGVTWVTVCVLAGVFFGRIPWVEEHFEAVIVAIVLISVVPVLIEVHKARRESARARAAGQDPAR